MEVRILEVRLAGGTKAVWRFSGEAACCCLELIEKVVIPEMLPGMLPVAAQVSVGCAPRTPDFPAGWRREELIHLSPEASVRRRPDGVVEFLLHRTGSDELLPLLPRIVWYGFLPQLLKREAVVAHGALLARDGSGIVVCGPSGAGKSTCARRIPPPWRALCDDAVLISNVGGAYFAQPLPTWSRFVSGELHPVRIGETVRLSGIYRLCHSDRERVNGLPPAEQVQILYRQFYDLNHMWRAGRRNSFWRSLNEAAVDFAFGAVRKVPVGELECSLTGEFWKELEVLS